MMSIVMMFGTVSAAAANDTFVTTTVPVFDGESTTTLPGEDADEETTEGNYEDGYQDGYEDGYYDGYGNGYNDGFNNGLGYGSGSNQTFFERIIEFIKDLRWRIEWFFDDVKDWMLDAMMIDFPAPNFDSAYLPAENQAVLGADALALCEEFNAMVEAARYVTETTTVTKTANVDIEVTDIMGGKLTEALINPILKEYLVADSSTEVQ